MKRLAIAAAVLLTACGGPHHTRTPAASEATVRTAKCHDWKTLTPAQRQRLVAGMREFFGGKVDLPGARGQVLPDAQAVAIFNSYCRQSYADGFSLYRLYGNAAAFTRPSNAKPVA